MSVYMYKYIFARGVSSFWASGGEGKGQGSGFSILWCLLDTETGARILVPRELQKEFKNY